MRTWTSSCERMKTIKTISPIIVTVLIVAVTLIAAVAIGGFGMFGTSSQTIQVSFVSAHLMASDFARATLNDTEPGYLCQTMAATSYLEVSNTGESGAYATSVEILWAGATTHFEAQGHVLCSVPAQQTVYFNFPTLSALRYPAVQNNSFSGSITLSNGAQILFAGTFK